MHYLLATDSVHTTAAGVDYLEDRLDAGDRVTVLAVSEPGDRDAGDALNVANARLVGRTDVETRTREGDPTDEILAVLDGEAVDVVLLGARGGRPGAGPELGATARAVLEGATVPVVVLPLLDLP
jgi:nucleotide-binding universal stress UspA family protein